MLSLVTEECCLHPLTLAEVLVGPVTQGKQEQLLQLLTAVGVAELPAGTVSPLEIATARATYGAAMPDAVILASAAKLGATIATFDDRLAERARRAGIPSLPNLP